MENLINETNEVQIAINKEKERLNTLLNTLSSEEYFGEKVTMQGNIKRIKKDGVRIVKVFILFKVGLEFDPLAVINVGTYYDKDDESYQKEVKLFLGKPFRQKPCVNKALDLIDDYMLDGFYVKKG